MGYTATMADNSGREQEQHLAQTATRSKRKLKGHERRNELLIFCVPRGVHIR